MVENSTRIAVGVEKIIAGEIKLPAEKNASTGKQDRHPQKSIFAPAPAKRWICPQCRHENQAEDLKCSECGMDKY